MKRMTSGALVLAALVSIASSAAAQQPLTRDAISEAQRLRASGDLATAASLLRSHLAQWPDDGDAARLLAQTLYWMKDIPAARSAYEAALARHPEDTTLILQYAGMLAETGQRARARELVLPLTQLPAARARADTVLGTLAYWEGNLAAAERLFTEALRANPDQQDAKRQLLEILTATASWVRVSSGIRHDDQPLDRVGFGFDARWFATPLVPVTVHFEPAGYWPSGTATRKLWIADVTVADYIPSWHVETELAGGIIHRSYGVDAADWQGHALAGIRLTPSVALRARIERAPYLYTTSSLTTPVMTQAATGSLHLNSSRGWLGEAGYQVQRYPDANIVTSAYAWLLVPLVHRGGNEFQLGYAVSSDTADESRFVLVNPAQPYLPGDPRFSTAGQYAPYYTPNNLVAHSAIGALALRTSRTTTLRLNGSYAVRATEDAPVLVVSRGQVQRTFFPHGVTPWNARTSFEVALGSLTVAAIGDFGRTSFYSWATAGVQVTHRFVPAGGAQSGTRR